MTDLRATYRLQLRGGVDLRRARSLADYLARLGVSHLYLSPVLRARRGSAHGYDTVDPRVLDPALGSERDLRALARDLEARGLGILLDIVPNHMAADPESPAFDDVLRAGPRSPFAAWFDVAWEDARGRRRPLLLPVLGRPLPECLAQGELWLVREEGELRVRYYERSFPLAKATLPPDLREALARRDDAAARAAIRGFAAGPGGRRRLGRLLGRQAYRLAYWKTARHRINYRRFFDISDLVGLRVEDPAVFDATQAKVLAWAEEGVLAGLRVDHVDGLHDPGGTLRRLRAALPERTRGGAPVALLVEKILAPDERLPAGWPVDGSTGYEFLNEVEALFVEPRGAAALEAAWARTTGIRRGFALVARDAKRRALRELLRADLSRLAEAMARLPEARGAEPAALADALVETIAHLPVYRAYAGRSGVTGADRARLSAALRAARRTQGARRGRRAACDRLRAVLLAPLPVARHARAARLEAIRRFGQLSGPAAAKGVEDTTLYRFAPLLSRNEVGGEPDRPLADAARALHAANRRRARRQPRGLLAASTHDTKRSADVRARLDVLSEIPDAWSAAVSRWRRWNAPLGRSAGGRRAPDAATELFLYQSLVGVWPLPKDADPEAVPGAAELAALAERLEGSMQKAAREAKARTSWISPDPRFEAALARFVRESLRPGRRSPFLRDVAALVAEIARPGLWNALARTLVQTTAPGAPDVYQGDELFSFALVDPDNRRPVDFARRRRMLAELERGLARDPERRVRAWVRRPEDGRVKLHLLRAALHARRRHPGLFGAGAYEPLRARGAKSRHVFAFLRRDGPRVAIVVAPRLARTLVGDARGAPVGSVWGDTRLVLPADLGGRRFDSALDARARRTPPAARGRVELPLAELLETFPGALWLGRSARG